MGDIPVLGELLFTHSSDVEREQNVVIYLTPYIVRRSGDLQKLKNMLSELEEVQDRYNTLFEKALEDKKSSFFSNSSSEDDYEETNSHVKSAGRVSNLDLLNETEEF